MINFVFDERMQFAAKCSAVIFVTTFIAMYIYIEWQSRVDNKTGLNGILGIAYIGLLLFIELGFIRKAVESGHLPERIFEITGKLIICIYCFRKHLVSKILQKMQIICSLLEHEGGEHEKGSGNMKAEPFGRKLLAKEESDHELRWHRHSQEVTGVQLTESVVLDRWRGDKSKTIP